MRLRITCCNGRDVFSAAKPPEKRTSGYSINRPRPERSSMIWNTLSSRVASRPAIATISIRLSQTVIHTPAFGLEGFRSIREDARHVLKGVGKIDVAGRYRRPRTGLQRANMLTL